MIQFLDTGSCVPESPETLRIQQDQLIRKKRVAQMFPIGTEELPLPEGHMRHANFRGVFHYNPALVSPEMIDFLGLTGSENQILNLGFYNKTEIAQRVRAGEQLTCIVEMTQDGVEIRSAAATDKTLPSQKAYFENTKEPNSVIVTGILPVRVANAIEGKK